MMIAKVAALYTRYKKMTMLKITFGVIITKVDDCINI